MEECDVWFGDAYICDHSNIYVPSVVYALFLDKNESLDVQIYPTEEDVDVDDVLVEDAEVVTLFSQTLRLQSLGYECYNASFCFQDFTKTEIDTVVNDIKDPESPVQT